MVNIDGPMQMKGDGINFYKEKKQAHKAEMSPTDKKKVLQTNKALNNFYETDKLIDINKIGTYLKKKTKNSAQRSKNYLNNQVHQRIDS